MLFWDSERLPAGAGQIAARIAGKGRTIVMLHSLLADSSSLDPLAGLLSRHMRVVLLDLPGFHESDFVDGPLEMVADCVAEGIRALELSGKVDLLGNGYGGFLAQLVAARHPGLVDRLLLVDAGVAFPPGGREALRTLSRNAYAKGMAAVADMAMRRLFPPACLDASPALVEERRKRFLLIEPRTFHAGCAALADADLRGELGKIQCPALVLAGELDEAAPPAMSQELATLLPRAELKILPGCAHLPQLQEPESFMKAIARFVGID